MQVSHYAIESVDLTRGRKLWLVMECDRDGNGRTVFTSRREEDAHRRAEALAVILRCSEALVGVQPDRPDLARALTILKGGAR